ncbi:MAG: OB-fold nucleic acid binding domain-containing protein, partial [bacterium]
MPEPKQISATAPAPPASKKPKPTTLGKIAGKLAKLGLRSSMDLALHLPLRYEDETQVQSIAEAGLRFGQPSQVEGVVTGCEIQSKPRRQLLVTLADDSGQVVLRFLNFYGSQQKQLAEGTRLRVRGELRHGFFGPEMVHPAYKIVTPGAPLATALTPVYPASVGLSQNVLRRAIALALDKLDWCDTLPPALLEKLGLLAFEPAIR